MAVVGYQRPSWPEMVFRDAQGQVIPYGSRWPGGSPAATPAPRTQPHSHDRRKRV